MEQRNALPAAILIGAIIIGAGLFLGLRSRPINIAPPPTPTPAPVSGVGQADPGWKAVSKEEQAKVTAEVQSAFEKQRAHFVEACWQSASTRKTRSDFEFRFIIGPKGQLLSYAVNDPKDAAAREIARCLRDLKPEVAVAPPGRPVTVQFATALP